MDCPNCGLELWSTTDGAAALGVSRKSWAQWRRREGFPAPVGQLGGRPVWDAAKVKGWAAGRSK